MNRIGLALALLYVSFFLAVGIVKPHLAFVCPASFVEMQANKIEPPAIRHHDLEDVPWVADRWPTLTMILSSAVMMRGSKSSVLSNGRRAIMQTIPLSLSGQITDITWAKNEVSASSRGGRNRLGFP